MRLSTLVLPGPGVHTGSHTVTPHHNNSQLPAGNNQTQSSLLCCDCPHSAMIGAVEDDEFDVQSGLMAGWAVTFCVLYIIVMMISIVLYLLTVRAMALEIRSHNTTYLLAMLLFFAAVIEFGVIMGEFMARFGHFSFTDLNCKLVVFTRHGNRILQVRDDVLGTV